MRAGVLTPTMTAVAFAFASLCATGAGANAAEQAAANARDQEFLAIQGLIDHDQRAPAQHLKDDFAGANYPADQWSRDALDWMYADRFRSSETDPAAQKKLDDLYTTIGPKLQAAVDANAADVPDVVKTMWKSKGSPLLRLVNDLGRVINPNLPPPLIGKANISAADKATRNHQVADLCAEAAKEFKKGEDAVTAFDAGPGAKIFEVKDDSPEQKKLEEQATTVRFEAIRPLYLAHIILREVLTRGDDFGIDPEPVKAFYKDLFTKDNVDTIGKYDYDWGDNNPWLKAYANVILCEAVRQGVKDVTADDIETEISKVIDDNPNTMNGPMRAQFVALQLNMLQHLIRWQLELNTPKSLKHGAELTAQIQDRVKNDSTLRLKGDDEKAIALAECYVVAARLAHHANNNTGVSTWLGPVMAARENPMSTNAKMWSVYFTGSSPNTGNDWGEEPSPEEPGAALATAQAYIQQANATPDAKQARGFYLKAAVSLRDAVLALTTPAYEDQFNDVGPQIYSEFASACYHLDMRYHAALVAEEGLRAVSLKVTDKTNPWKGNEAVKRLEGNGIAYAQGLQARASGPAVAHIWDDTIGLIKKISPEDGNKSLDRMQIQLDITTGQWDDAIHNLDAYAKTYPDPDEQFWAFNNRINAMQGHFNALAAQFATNPGVQDDMDKVGAATSKIANDMLAKLADTLKIRALTDPELKARASAQTVELYQDFAAGRYKDVIDKLGPDFWKHPPGDESLAVSMLKMMSNATYKFHDQTFSSDAAKKDPGAALQANWPIYQGVYALFKSHSTNYKSPESVKPLRDSSRLLAAVFNGVSNLGEPLRGTSTAITAMLDEARKATADLVAPTLSANSKSSQLVAIGDLLFNMDDHAGAGRLYAFYLANLDNDADLQAFVQAPKTRLDEVENIIGSRPELKTEWAKLRDRLEDQDHTGVTDRSQWGELPINYGIAVKLLKDFIAHVDQMKTVLGNDLAKQADDELSALQKIVFSLAQRIRVKSRLAQIDRETGKSDESRKLYDELISYDPDDPDFKVAYVENVIADVKNPPPTGVPPKDQLEKARSTAVDLRDNANSDLFTYWTASIQVMELSFALDDLTPINNTLHHITASRSDLSQDLVQPQVRADKRITGDDKRVRRAKNALAGTLAQRFLDLYGKPGVTEKPLFRVATVTVDGKDWILFIDAGAPDMVGTTTTNEEGTDVVVFRPAGDAVEQPESATSAAAAGSATPAAAAPPADNAATPAAPSPSATGAAP